MFTFKHGNKIFLFTLLTPTPTGAPDKGCESGPESVGLWVDALNFVIITLQIIIFDTEYTERIREDLIEKEESAG